LALTLGRDKAAVGMLIALFALPQMLLALPVGRWADRRGLQVPVRWSVGVAILGGLVSAISPGYLALCVSAVCAGSAIAAAAIALQRHVGRAARNSNELRQAFSWLSLAPAFSNFVGPFTVGLVIDHAGYRTAFLVLAALPLLGWLWIRTAQELPNEHPEDLDSSAPWNLLREATFRRLLLMNWFSAASFDVHGFVVPVLGHERGLSASAIGTILGCFAIAAAAVRGAIPLVLARLQEWKVITGAMSIATVVLLLYPFAHSPIAMCLCSALIGISVGCVQPMVMSLLHQVTPSHRHGEVVAMRHLMVNVSSVAMPLLFGAAGGLIGISSVLWLMGLAVALGTKLSLGLRGVGEGGWR
ncbi:MAG TPA: MFS transporter, partial [Burkholderiales bacterium]|nr:MFS transporter [Burkholderiales bacterium]